MAFDIRREAYSAFAGTRLLRMRLSLFLQKPCSAGRAEALPYGIIPYFPPCWPFTKGKQRPPCLKGAVTGARAGDWGIRSSPSEGGTSAKLTGEGDACRTGDARPRAVILRRRSRRRISSAPGRFVGMCGDSNLAPGARSFAKLRMTGRGKAFRAIHDARPALSS